MIERPSILPASLPPRGLSRERAAAYIGVSPSTFDRMVTDKQMPKPIQLRGRKVWDRLKLDDAFAALDEDDAAPRNIWDEVT